MGATPRPWAHLWYHISMRQSIHVRLPRGLHEQLAETAVEQDVSLNSLIATLLAGAVGFSLDPDKERPGAVGAARGTTHEEIARAQDTA